jgi:hypothetical protein
LRLIRLLNGFDAPPPDIVGRGLVADLGVAAALGILEKYAVLE